MQMKRVRLWLAAVALLVVFAPSLTIPLAATVTTLDDAVSLNAIPQPTTLAAGVAGIITGLLLLLFMYRRRLYILYWTGGWACLAASMAAMGRSHAPTQLGAFIFGTAQFLALVSSLLFVVAADAYHTRPRLRRLHALLLLPVAAWFLLAPLALGPVAVLVPGYVLTAIALAVSGGAHLVILRDTRLLGAGVVGTMLLITSVTNVWLSIAPQPGAQVLSEAFLLELALYLVTALGMQLMTFEDMTYELRRANGRLETAQAELRQMVVTDALTGCRNRRFFDEIIAHELNQHRRYGTPISLLFVDVDQFKTVNDTLGHSVGDRVLREVAAFLMRKTRDADYVFRWGGDEFLLLLSCREEEAVRRGRDLDKEFMQSTTRMGLPAGVGLSFGCAEVSPLVGSALDALKLADERMYANKRRARMSDVKAM